MLEPIGDQPVEDLMAEEREVAAIKTPGLWVPDRTTISALGNDRNLRGAERYVPDPVQVNVMCGSTPELLLCAK